MAATAPAVSAMLARAGLRPTADRRREGIRVTRGALAGQVHVGVSIDTPTRRAHVFADVRTALREAGYAIVREDNDPEFPSVTVTREPCDDCRALPGEPCHVDCSSRWA